MNTSSDFLTFLQQKKGQRVLHLGHKDADCDALGSAYAVSKLLPGDIGFAQGLKTTAADLADWLEVTPVIDPDPNAYDFTVIYDCYTTEILACPVPEHYALFDHHTPGGRRLLDFQNQMSTLADWRWLWPSDSTCSVIAQLFLENAVPFDQKMAIALASGIVTDTFMLKFANAESFRLLSEILGCHGQYLEDVLAVIHPSERVAIRRAAVFKAIQTMREEKIGPWSVLALHTDSHDHGLTLFNILNHLGGDANVVCFPKSRTNGRNVNMVMVECEQAFSQQTGIHLGELVAEVAKQVEALDTWGSKRVGRIIAAAPKDDLLDLCMETLIQALMTS